MNNIINWFNNSIEVCNVSNSDIIAYVYTEGGPVQIVLIHKRNKLQVCSFKVRLYPSKPNYIAVCVNDDSGRFCLNTLVSAGDFIEVLDADIAKAIVQPSLFDKLNGVV